MSERTEHTDRVVSYLCFIIFLCFRKYNRCDSSLHTFNLQFV